MRGSRPVSLSALISLGHSFFVFFQPSSNFISNDKYKIADYGFLSQTVTGTHDGDVTNDSNIPPGPWSSNAVWIEADLNGDGHVDMFSIGNFAGIDTWNPDGLLMAWINDGDGHFTLSLDIFADGADLISIENFTNFQTQIFQMGYQ